jgi:flagellar motor switch protein FliN/FliY
MEKGQDMLDIAAEEARKRAAGQESTTRKLYDLSLLEDVPLTVIVELGRSEISLRQLLTLKTGSTIELNKLAGEPLEFRTGENIAAKGEVVVLNEKLGLRLTDIIDPAGQDEDKV